MKIEIEFDSSYSAKLTIDGREMSVESKPGLTCLEGIKSPETENTFGGIVACQLYSKVAEIQQAWAAASEIDVDSNTWDELSDEAVEAAEEKFW